MSEITTIVLFEVPEMHAERFLLDWQESNAFMTQQDGLIEGTLYQASEDNALYRFVNIARWASEEALDRARDRLRLQLAERGIDQKATWAVLGIKVSPFSYSALVNYQRS
ncbi:hypothetical protein C5748_10920 [Phyllobacterium phragmitis]|uniref:ABM domain-containing protein n=1 Tax=Phyllobacterium phragmitis TaxID=2670329 RepID=A0A2S9IT86_9HYPH|nr:antibiotic biosynthesis monooxygenase [Phyllobacterium phragmitis]PRD43742.1 hypothetical protein C5748_10920 [Phyllobacterium phragmitis]